MNSNYLVLGYFGFITNQLDGQTVKTRNIYQLLKLKENEIGKVSYFDTQQFQKNKLFVIVMFWKVLINNRLIYIPAHNNFTYLFPVIFLLSKLKRVKITYIVVGGWLNEYIVNKRIHRFMLSKIQVILPQTKKLTDALKSNYNLKNVQQLNNYRLNSFVPNFVKKSNSFKIVFMARINKFKGIENVFKLAERIAEDANFEKNITIDFYGQISAEDKSYFFKELNRFNNVFYKGQLEPFEIYSNLEKYDVLVLPTFYIGEGFPGSILDAYISGIPVIVSNWKELPEFVDHNETGFIFDLNNNIELYNYIIKLYENPKLLANMKQNAYNKSKEYSSESAWKILKPYLIK